MDQAKNNYLNTLTFTVIAEAMTVVILGILVFSAVKPFSAFLLTVEIGLLTVVCWALYSIQKNKGKLQQQFKNLKNNMADNVPCPDYYVRDGDDKGKTICKNGYTTPDGRFTYKFHTRTPNSMYSDDDLKTIPVDAMFQGQKLQDVCNNSLNPMSLYGEIPWTGVKPNCNNLGGADDIDDYLKQ